MKRIKLAKTRAEWLESRKAGIGGSDAGAVAGINPYKSPFTVYCEKCNLIDGEVEDSEAMRIGRDLEDYVAKRFCEETGLKVRKSGFMFQSEENKFMLANIDRLIVGEKAFLECKTSNAYNQGNFSQHDIPAHHYAQLCHYMAVTEFDYCFYAVLVLGIKFEWIKLSREEMQEDIDNLISIEKDFWNNHVLAGVAPSIDGSESTGKTIDDLFSETIPDEQAEISSDLLEAREELKAQAADLKKQIDELENKIKFEFGAAEIGLNESYNVSYKKQIRKGSIDTEAMIQSGINPDDFRKPSNEIRVLNIRKKKSAKKVG